MKVPPKRKGNFIRAARNLSKDKPSMKVPPKRKGNAGAGVVSSENTLSPQ